MQKIKYVLIMVACLSLGSCGIFKKGCGCPTFGKYQGASSGRLAIPGK